MKLQAPFWLSGAAWLIAALTVSSPQAARVAAQSATRPRAGPLFETAANCMACHNGLTTASGEDVSIGSSWRASMMANSSRDPYWQAAVRREVIDHPGAREDIEDECSTCHMPMTRTLARINGRKGAIFAHLPIGAVPTVNGLLAADGVSCTMCHQIQPDGLGTRASFTGGFVVDPTAPPETRSIFGSFQIDVGRTTIMRSATGFRPGEGLHIRNSELCATCHTLYTNARGPNGAGIGQLPEQVPYLEWQHSA